MPLWPGEIYRLCDDKRPVIVVSREELNRGDYLVCVLLTTQRLEERRNLPHCVPFKTGQFGLTAECVAQAETITVVEKTEIDLHSGRLGALSGEAMRDVIRAIGNVVSAQCEPL